MAHKLWELFWTFTKIGVMMFGGGYAMLPLLQREVVETHHWATEEEMADYYAIGQCTPGIIAVNVATFIGQKEAGIPGAIAATVGQVLPSLIIISVIAGVLTSFASLQIVQDAFGAVRACVCVLILNAVLRLMKTNIVDVPTFLIFIAVLAVAMITNVSPVVFVLLSGVLGVVIRWLQLDGEARKGAEK